MAFPKIQNRTPIKIAAQGIKRVRSQQGPKNNPTGACCANFAVMIAVSQENDGETCVIVKNKRFDCKTVNFGKDAAGNENAFLVNLLHRLQLEGFSLCKHMQTRVNRCTSMCTYVYMCLHKKTCVLVYTSQGFAAYQIFWNAIRSTVYIFDIIFSTMRQPPQKIRPLGQASLTDLLSEGLTKILSNFLLATA